MEVYESDSRLQEILGQLINGFFGESAGFQMIYDSLLLHNDTYFVLKDFAPYVDIQDIASNVYRDQKQWQKMSTINIAHSGIFSSDRSIEDYEKRVWKVK